MRRRIALVAALACLVLIGCTGGASPGASVASPAASGASSPGASQGAPADWLAGAGSDWDTLLAAARSEGTVAVGGPAFLADPMTAAFTADTGIALEWIGATGSELSARIAAEAETGNVTMDGKLGGAQELFSDWAAILEPIAPKLILPGVTEGANWRQGGVDWYDPDKQYMLKGSQYVFGWVIVNADEVDPASIVTWDDLLKPEFKGRIAAGDITGPSPGQGAAHAIYNYKGMDYIEDLYIGQEVTFTTDNAQLVEWAARATYPIIIGSIQSQVERFKAEGFNLQAVLPEDGPGYLTSGFSVLMSPKGAPHPNAAQVFMNWYASLPGATTYQTLMLETSQRLDVDKSSLPPYVVPVDGVEYWVDSDLDWFLEQRADVSEQFVELVGGR
jgi:ABC-type Fe3+ transport system substrate-binding protein